MPRPAKAIAQQTRHYSQAQRLEREIVENGLKAARDDLTPPAWLDDAARQEFARVVDEAGKVGLLDNLDLSILALYADSYSQYQEAAQHLKIEGMAPGGKVNPFQRVATDAAKTILACSSKLGLAATDRLKLAVGRKPKQESPVNKWLQFLPQETRERFEANA